MSEQQQKGEQQQKQDAVDNFFSPLENTKPYLKLAFEGFAGSGKTFTMARIAVGLHKRIGSTKPIIYFDTEKAGGHLRRFFAEHDIKVLHKESRTLADLKETMKRCRDGADILLIDSISHVWENFLQSYQKQKNRQRLQFEDWGILKPKWKEEFSEPFVRDRYHALMCGRAGYEYADEKVEDPNTGKIKREIYKSGVKMKVEGETAYEPDMLIMMERFEEVLEKDKKVWREATILKDRANLIDGKTFKNPSYADFEPAIEYLLDGAVEGSPTPEKENEFDNEERGREIAKARAIALEKIEAELAEAGLAGTSGEAKKARVEAMKASFGTASRTEVEGMHPEKLSVGLEALKKHIAERKAAANAEAA